MLEHGVFRLLMMIGAVVVVGVLIGVAINELLPIVMDIYYGTESSNGFFKVRLDEYLQY